MKKSIFCSIGSFLLSFAFLFAQENSSDVYPQSSNYWTGTTDGITKTDPCEVRAINIEDGWLMFDVSSLSQNLAVDSIALWIYASTYDFPRWSATPMPYNCVTASAPEIYAAIQAGQDSSDAYLYITESSSITPGWRRFTLSSQANTDLQASISQGWFAVGIGLRDDTPLGLTIDGWCSFNVPWLAVYYSIVPVELTSFNAVASGGKVMLSWTTATEKNNRGFKIQRRKSEPSGLWSEWKDIGYVEGSGTTSKPHNYLFTDYNLSSGKYSYRLKQIDFNGSFEYSNVLEVSIDTPAEFSLEQNYPNPFNPVTKIKYSIPQYEFVTLKVYDALGREVANLVNDFKPAGKYEVEFNAYSDNHQFSSGIYFYKLKAGSFTQVKKMILMK